MEHSYRKFAHVSSVFSQCHDIYREHNLQKITGTSTAESHLCNSFCLGWWPDQCIDNAIDMDRPTSGSFLFQEWTNSRFSKFKVHVPTVLGQAKSMVETSTSILTVPPVAPIHSEGCKVWKSIDATLTNWGHGFMGEHETWDVASGESLDIRCILRTGRIVDSMNGI